MSTVSAIPKRIWQAATAQQRRRMLQDLLVYGNVYVEESSSGITVLDPTRVIKTREGYLVKEEVHG